MNQRILLVSRNERVFLSKFDRDTLISAGYQATRAESPGRAVALIFFAKPDLVILEESITEGERTAFIECLQENNLGTQVLFLQAEDVRPEILLEACRSILSAQPGSRPVHVMQEFATRKSV